MNNQTEQTKKRGRPRKNVIPKLLTEQQRQEHLGYISRPNKDSPLTYYRYSEQVRLNDAETEKKLKELEAEHKMKRLINETLNRCTYFYGTKEDLEKQQIVFYGKQKFYQEKSELEYNQYLAKQDQVRREKNLTAYVVSIILVLIYLVLSSIANSFNPTKWSTSVVFAFICLISLLIVLILIKIVAENEAKKDIAEIEDINQKLK